MLSQADRGTRILDQFDPLILVGSIVTLFVALGTEPWWTLKGTAIASLFTVQVSPFYANIDAIGMASTVPFAGSLGSLTRTFLLVGFLAFFGASIRPTSWWRNIAIYFGLSSLVELFLSFLLMYYWVETAFENALGIVPPYYGTTTLQANVVGLDLSYYQAPSVTATFNLPYYLGFLSLGLVLGRSFVTFLQQRGIPAINSLLSGTGIRDIYLSPPYHQVWFSSEDAQFNPMQRNPETMKDDEILVSFERLFETVEPGGSLLVILPDWATGLADRLEVLLPQTGFTLEKTTLVSRTSGKSENELRFRKPIVKPVATADLISPTEQSSTPEFQQLGGQGAEPKTDQSNNPPESIQSSFAAETPPPVSETAQAFAWVQTRMTKLERSMLKVAIQIISERRQPVPYRELLNQVYMDLVDHKIEFDSARQIETTLLQHNGKELSLLEEGDNNGIRPIKKWWLGDQKMSSDNSHGLPGVARIREVGPKLQRIRERFLKSKPRYSSKKDDESDSDHLDS